jgi:hypothetical protein
MKYLISSFISLTALVVVTLLFLRSTEKDEEVRVKEFNENYAVYALELPMDLKFAGEPVPMNVIDVKERLDRELLVNTYWQSQTLLLIKRASRWFPLIDSILIANEVPLDFKYLALAESGLMNVVSPSGAAGYWQFLKQSGIEYNMTVNGNIDQRYDVELSTVAATKYLRKAKNKFGSWTLAAASYNMGIDGLENLINSQNVNSYYDLLLSNETSRYVFRILALTHICEHPESYGFHLRQRDLYQPYNYSVLDVDSSIQDLARFSAVNNINYKELKLLNPWLRQTELLNTTGTLYHIKIINK